jgi:hypothetical protein
MTPSEVFWIDRLATVKQAQALLLRKSLLFGIGSKAFLPPIGPSLA